MRATRRKALPKIALVAPSVSMLGGQASQVKTLADHLRSDGYQVDVVPIDPPLPKGVRWLKRLPVFRTLMNQGLYLPSLGRIRQADMVQIMSAPYWSFLLASMPAILAARRLKKPIILNYQSGQAADHLAHWGSLVHPWLKMVDEIVVPSIFLQDVFARHGYRAHVIQHVIDSDRFRYRRRVPLVPSFLSITNFEPHSGVEYTLLAFALLKTAFPEATLTIVGMGPQEPEAKRFAEALGLRNVRFIGPVKPSAMPSFYDVHSIFLDSSFVNNQSVSVLEAMACGMPIVATAVGDMPNIVEDGISGTLVPAGDPTTMAKAVTHLFKWPERSLLLAQRAKDSLARFAWASVGPSWTNIYRRICGSPQMLKAA